MRISCRAISVYVPSDARFPSIAANWMIYGCWAMSHHLVENPVVSVSQTQIFIRKNWMIKI